MGVVQTEYGCLCLCARSAKSGGVLAETVFEAGKMAPISLSENAEEGCCSDDGTVI